MRPAEHLAVGEVGHAAEDELEFIAEDPGLYLQKPSTTARATCSANGGGTEFPICRYRSHWDPQKTKSGGNP